MKLTVKEQVQQEREIDIEFPAFFRLCGIISMIGEDGNIVRASSGFGCVYNKGDYGYDQMIAELTAKGKPATECEFHEAVQSLFGTIAALAGYEVNLNLITKHQEIEA